MMLTRRLKTLVFLATLWASPALAQGTTPLALVPQIDLSGNVASGCLLYFFVAGTVSTPQNSYADFGMTQQQPNPLVCDQSGRVPMHWLANGLIHIRLVTSSGTPLVDTTMQVLGPSSGGGGGGGGTVDPTTILSTGDEKVRYGTGSLTGFVRENGLSIGNSTSGATERANADTQNLFVYLYGADPNLVVSGGRTGNAINDFNASKTIALPDMRGMANVGLADMGNTATTVLTSTYAGCSSVTTLGEGCGSQNQTVLQANFPSVNLSISGITLNNGSLGTSGGSSAACNNALNHCSGGSQALFMYTSTASTTDASTNSNVTVSAQGTAASGGSGTPLATVQPIRLKTFYIKL